MDRDILFALWVFVPAGIANVMPVFVSAIPLFRRFDAPLDFGKTFRGQRIFGQNKRWRGLLIGMIAATVALGLQQYLVAHTGWAQALVAGQVDYSALPLLIVGPLFGLGALGGDAIESFFKRQHGVPPGHSWFPWDQIDYIIGGAIAVAPFIILSATQYILLIILWLAVHLISSYLGYLLGLKDRPI